MFWRPDIAKLLEAGKVKKIYKYLRHRKSDVRIESFNALYSLYKENPDSVELAKLRIALKDKDGIVKNNAVLSFARLGDTSIMDELYKIVVKGGIDEQIEVLRLLPRYYTANDDRVTNIIALGLNAKRFSVQLEAIRSIGDMLIESMAYSLFEFTHHSNSKIRLDSISALGKIKNPASIDYLKGALTDSSPDVRKAAEYSLKAIDTPEALDALKDAPFLLMVKNMNESVAKRLVTVTNIGKARKLIGLPLLHKACFDEFKNVRFEAIKSISLLKENSSVDILLELMNDHYFDVRIEAIKAISRYDSPRVLEALNKAKNDSNTNVKSEAKKAYYAMNIRLNQKKE